MVAWLCVSLGVAFGLSVLPVMSVELFVLGLVTGDPDIPWAGVGAVVAFGQVGGKLLYYLGAKGTIQLPSALQRTLHREPRPPSARRDRWHLRTKRIRRGIEAIRERCRRHPRWLATTYAASSVFGMPPLMAMTLLAGLARMPLALFLSMGLLGRFVRFSALAATPSAFVALFGV